MLAHNIKVSASGQAVFRCDASPVIGAGHVMRSLAFADTLTWAGWTCAFITNPDAATVVPALAASGIPVRTVDPDARSFTLDDSVSLVVIDHYGLDADFEREFAQAGRTVVVFDDLADRPHACDILVDPKPGRQPDDYRSSGCARTRMLLGPDHAMIGRRWIEERPESRARLRDQEKVEHIMVSMGATDPVGATGKIIDAIGLIEGYTRVDIVLGRAAPHRESVETALTENMSLHIEPSYLPWLAARADLAIGAAGSSSFERMVLGLPALVVPIAENQRAIGKSLNESGAVEQLPKSILCSPEDLAARISSLVADGQRRRQMSVAAGRLTDGRGCLRLLLEVAGTVNSRCGASIKLRLAGIEDEHWLLNLQRLPSTRKYAQNPAIPSDSEHSKWFASTLDDPDRMLAIILESDVPVGMVRIDRVNDDPITFEVSIAIDVNCHGRGIGSAALRLLRRVVPTADLVADIHPKNVASLSLFSAAGYRPDTGDRYRCRA